MIINNNMCNICKIENKIAGYPGVKKKFSFTPRYNKK